MAFSWIESQRPPRARTVSLRPQTACSALARSSQSSQGSSSSSVNAFCATVARVPELTGIGVTETSRNLAWRRRQCRSGVALAEEPAGDREALHRAAR